MNADSAILIYFLACLTVGLLCFSLIAVAALAFRDSFTARFFQFYASFSLLTIFSVVLMACANGALRLPEGVFSVLIYLSVAANGLFVAALPDYTDFLKRKRSPRRRWFWLGGALAYGLFVALSLEIDLVAQTFRLPLPHLIVAQILFLVAIVYSFLGSRLPRKSTDPGLESRFTRRFELASLCFLPGIVLDIVLSGSIQFRFFPLLYACISVVFTIELMVFIRATLRTAPTKTQSFDGQSLPDRGWLDGLGISPREREVLTLLLQGRNNREVADRLCISVPTVKTHAQNIFRKTGVGGRFELLRFISAAASPEPPDR